MTAETTAPQAPPPAQRAPEDLEVVRTPKGAMQFSFSDTVAGYVTSYDRDADAFGLRTADGREFSVRLTDSTYAELVRNLDEPFADASGPMREMLTPGRYLQAYGVFYPEAGAHVYEAKRLVFLGRGPDDFRFERPDWWVDQVRSLAAFYRRAQFGVDTPIDYRDYRTVLRLGGDKTDSHVQETDTISRMVYGMASAYMLTGNEEFLEVAEKGTEYLRDHMRFVDRDEDVTYWYHGVRVEGERETKLFTSEFGDDYDAVPMYEQIYALAGPTQTYRVTGDPRIMEDIDGTMRLFRKFFRDEEGGGYYSHVDPILLSPHTESLGANRAKKNWNSVGDHAPAYLVNLWLATGDPAHADFLEDTFDTIATRFPDYEHSPFVNERFNEDWTHDTTYAWQQDRAVVGHNLKIAWNLMRMNSLRPKAMYQELAEKIGKLMPSVGSDLQRGGWYDVVERVLKPGQEQHRFVWHDRKAWWQQEQAILAYLILAGTTGDEEYLRLARESSAFYNTFFLDHDEGAVYFNVLADGMPYLLGTERFKGSHSMSMYHSAELCYLAAVYTNLLVHKRPMDFWFKPYPGSMRDGLLRVQPDILPPGAVRITSVLVDDKPYDDFDADALTVRLPETDERVTVRVTLTPTAS